MASAIENFFLAWGAPDDSREAAIRQTVTEDVSYADPRGTVDGAAALADYVAQYSANAPGSAAEAVEVTKGADETEVRVRFYGDWGEQFGRYTVTLAKDGLISKMQGIAEQAE